MFSRYITASQIRAARALLNWSQDDLANNANLSIATIRKIEAGHISPRDSTMGAIKAALEAAEVEFMPMSGLRLRGNEVITIEGDDAYLQLLEDVYGTMKSKKGEVLFFYADSSAANEEETSATARIRKLGAKWRFITEEGNTFLHWPLEEYRWLPKKFYKRHLQLVYGNKVAMACSFDEEKNQTTRILVVESAVLAKSMRNMFEFMWESCRKPPFTTAPKVFD